MIDCVLRICNGRISDPRTFALRHRTLVVERGQIPVDVSLAALPFERRMMERASLAEYQPGVSLRTASAEDLVVMKVFAGRPRDIEDVRGVIVRRGNALERAIVLDELAQLEALSERHGLVDCFQRLCDRSRP